MANRQRVKIGDCRKVLRNKRNLYTACVTDPPYNLAFMGKRWDKTGVAFDPETWKVIYRALKPGAMLLAFGGTRTYHRLVCAIEDAGFEIRDCLMWLYGSGFPKSHDVSKAIDKAAGAERKVVGQNPNHRTSGDGTWSKEEHQPHTSDGSITAAATPAAKTWEGYGTALKPAHEIIVCAQKPLAIETIQGIIVENLLTLEARLWSLLPAKIAVRSFKLSRADYNAACDFAQWNADERSNIRGDLFGQMGMSQSVLVMNTILSIVSSWRIILGESCKQAKTSTTSTVSGMTIDWKTLSLCVSGLTLRSIIQAELQEPGLRLSALPAARYLSAACVSIASTRELSAVGSAIAKGHTLPPDDLGLAPNWEPIVLAMKPLDGTFAKNALEHGVAGINVDEGRISTGDKLTGSGGPCLQFGGQNVRPYQETFEAPGCQQHPSGRWPANLILSHHPKCMLVRQGEYACVESCPVGMLDEQSGELKAGVAVGIGASSIYGSSPMDKGGGRAGFGDSGGASRFFYCAKAGKKERTCGGKVENKHPTVKPLALMRYLLTLVSSPKGSVILDPFCGSGSTLIACRQLGLSAVGIDSDVESVKAALRRLRASSLSR